MASMNVQAWFMGDSDADQREEHHCNPPEYVDEEYIGKHGIKFWKVSDVNFNESHRLTCSRVLLLVLVLLF